MVNLEKAAHDATKEILEDREADIRKFKETSLVPVSLARRKRRAAVDEMLNQYKEDLER